MKTIDEIKAEIMNKANQEIEKATKECTVREMVKIQPRYVHCYPLYQAAGSLVYDVKTKSEALEIAKSFGDITPSYLCKSSRGTSVKCFDDPDAKETVEYYAGLHIDRYNATIQFFTIINETWRIDIKLPVCMFGYFYKSDPRARINFKRLFKPKPLNSDLHLICKYTAAGYRGENSFGEEIRAIYDFCELERQLTEETDTIHENISSKKYNNDPL